MYSLREEIEGYRTEILALRRDFHEHPELGYKEFRTSKTIYDYLKAIGCDSVQNIAKTGVVGTLYGERRRGKTVILRANMDALPITEDTHLSYASQTPGVMHAGGHDAHMAVALVVGKLLSRHRDAFRGCVRLVFQPNEEIAGALDMIREGVLEDPPADAALSMNFTQMIDSGKIGLSRGAVIGNTEEFILKLIGKSGNTYLPNKSIDAALGAAKIMEAVQILETREYDPMRPISIMFGKVHGGAARNIVIDKITLEGTIRFLFPEDEDNIDVVKSAFERIVKSVCSMLGLGYQIEYIHSNSSLVNSKEIVDVLRRTARTTYDGRDNIVDFKSLMGEDFAEFGKLVPSAMTFFGVNSEAKHCIYPNYHPKYNIDEDVLPEAVEYFYRGIVELLRDLP